MKYLSYISIAILLWSCEQTVYNNPGYTLVFEDNFQGESIDETKWNFEIGTGCQYGPNLNGWGNFEDQYYKKENASIVDNDFLQIESKEEYVLYSDACGANQSKNYTSARLNTRNKFDFTYGKVEASIKLDNAVGIWHAFWMLPSFPQEIWPFSGEIDILEFANQNNKIFYAGTLHHTGPLIGSDIPFTNLNYFNDFHTYSVEWDLSTIKWYVDDALIQTVVRTSNSVLDDNWPFDKEFHIILNTAVGGTLGGTPNLNGELHHMQVDYVRVYQKINN
jgi:beta-glucanase (GH16 family)